MKKFSLFVATLLVLSFGLPSCFNGVSRSLSGPGSRQESSVFSSQSSISSSNKSSSSSAPSSNSSKLESNQPILSINTSDGLAITSKFVYKAATINMQNAGDGNNLNAVKAEVRGRGNSTWNYSKKSYRIRFLEKTSVFGFPKAKNWVLLADYLDPSSIRNYAALTFANTLPGFPYKNLVKHVVVYLNDNYKGLYLLTQNPDEKEGRVNLEQEITATTDINTVDYMLEFDHSAVEPNSDAILNETYFVSKGFSNWEISLKYPNKEDFDNEVQFRNFFNRFKREIDDFGNIINNGAYEQIAELVDETSLASFAVEDLLTGSKDHQKKSFKFYKKGDIYYFGPCWDYDYSTFVPWTGKPAVTTGVNGIIWTNTNECIRKYVATEEGKQKVGETWKQMYESGKYQSAMDDILMEIENISIEAELNNDFWYNNEYDFTKSTENVMEFYEKQAELMNAHFGVNSE